MHVLPRKKGDFQKEDEIHERMSAHDKEGHVLESKSRSDQEMANEAAEFRKLFY